MKQIDPREVAGLSEFMAQRSQPLAATDGSGTPLIVFDESGQLVMTEVPN